MKARNKKAALAALAVLLPAVLYSGGVLAQIITNYKTWQLSGGDYSVAPGLPSLRIADCLNALLRFPDGLIAILILAASLAILCVFGLRLGWGATGTTDA